MKRSAKNSYSWGEFVEQMLSVGVDVEGLLKPVCHLFGDKEVELNRCLLRCVSPCSHFFNFEFVTNSCGEDSCSNEFPCVCCLEQIEEQKLLMRCVLATNTPHTQLHVTHKKAPPIKWRFRHKRLMLRK
jgi:hypothetical protein